MKNCNLTKHNTIMGSSQAIFSGNKNKGEKSNRTPSPQGAHKFHCAKLDGLVDAVAEAKQLV